MKKSIFLSIFLILAVSLILISFKFKSPPKHFPYILSDHYTRVNDYPELLLQAQSLPTFGFIMQNSKKNFERLRVNSDYLDKLYPVLLNSLSEDEKKCLKPGTNAPHITLKGYLANPRSDVADGGRFDFKVNGIFREKVIKVYPSFEVEETWYEAAVESPQLLSSFRKILHPEILHISIGVSRKIISTSQCFG
jgi:hypothetical protein